MEYRKSKNALINKITAPIILTGLREIGFEIEYKRSHKTTIDDILVIIFF